MPQTKTPHCFIAIYTGNTIADARIVAASTDPELLTLAVRVMLDETAKRLAVSPNPVVSGQRHALKQIARGIPTERKETPNDANA